MFPSTEPIRTRPVEPFGEEKNGTSLRYDHRISPLSWDSRNTQLCPKISQEMTPDTLWLTHRVEAEEAPPQRSHVKMPK